jgi:hypothetical protein
LRIPCRWEKEEEKVREREEREKQKSEQAFQALLKRLKTARLKERSAHKRSREESGADLEQSVSRRKKRRKAKEKERENAERKKTKRVAVRTKMTKERRVILKLQKTVPMNKCWKKKSVMRMKMRMVKVSRRKEQCRFDRLLFYGFW